MSETRDLEWAGCANVRDLGGLPLAGGGQTRRGAIIRADLLGKLTPDGKQALLDYGVRTVVDLRGAEERATAPTAVFPAGGPAIVTGPPTAMDPALRARMNAAGSMAEIYRLAVDHNREEMAWGLRAVAQAAAGGVAFHCHSGKDRIGILAGLILSLAGVPDEAVAMDYAASQARLQPSYEKLVTEAGGEEALADPYLRPLTPPEAMMDLLAHVRETYGGAAQYMHVIGLADDEIAQLRRRLTL